MAKQMFVQQAGDAEALNVMGARVTFLCTADKTDKAWSLMEVSLPRDSGPPPHDHPWDEAYYVMAGEVRFLLAGAERIIKAGDFVFAPAGTLHGFQGHSQAPAKMLIFDAPAHAEDFFREVEREVKDPAVDMAKVPQIGSRHQIRFVRPSAAA